MNILEIIDSLEKELNTTISVIRKMGVGYLENGSFTIFYSDGKLLLNLIDYSGSNMKNVTNKSIKEIADLIKGFDCVKTN